MTRPHVPGRLVLRTRPDVALEHVTAHRDVRLGHSTPALSLDGGGSLDQALRRHSSGFLATRAFTSRTHVLNPGFGHMDWVASERALGLDRTFRVALDPTADMRHAAADLRALSSVESASPEFIAEGTNEIARLPIEATIDGPRAIVGAKEALEMEPGDSALIVGLVDSGVSTGHPELRGRLRPGLSSVAMPKDRLSDGTEIISGARARLQDVDDDEGHGTACASIIAAIGVFIPGGLAGVARLLPIRSLCGAWIPGRERPTAIGTLEDINSGLKNAIDLGARVINMSFGTSAADLEKNDPIPHTDVVQYALAHDCVLVAASGNSGKPEEVYPAALQGVIAVGSVDGSRRPSSFTTRGSHVTLCAPGERVATAGIDGSYTLASGTSFAAPLVASACALILSRAARYSTPLTPSTVRDLLVRAASPFGRGADAQGCGAGVLDIPAALRAVDMAYRAAVSGEAA
jgi:subtilisin family serine protease